MRTQAEAVTENWDSLEEKMSHKKFRKNFVKYFEDNLNKLEVLWWNFTILSEKIDYLKEKFE